MRRRSTMVAGGAAAAVLSLVAAGCGGGGGERLTLEEFVAQADAICAEFDKKFDALGEPQSAEEVSALVREGKGLAEEQLAALRELSPPEDTEAKIEEAYAALDEQIGLFDSFADATEANDEATIQEITGKLGELNAKADEVAAEIGLEECGSG